MERKEEMNRVRTKPDSSGPDGSFRHQNWKFAGTAAVLCFQDALIQNVASNSLYVCIHDCPVTTTT